MNPDILLAILKISGAFISGTLGLTALFSSFRDQNGHLTLAGKAVLAGILISTGVAATSSLLESFSSYRSNQEQLSRNEALLRQISRAVQPISEIKISYFVTIPAGTPLVDDYMSRLELGVEQRAVDLLIFPPEKNYGGLSISSTDADHQILSVSIQPESDLWPQLPEEVAISNLIMFGAPSISLVRNPVSPSEYPLVQGEADLSALGLLVSDSPSLNWNPQEKTLQIFGSENYAKDLWAASGRITSYDDLLGAQLALIFPYSDPEFVERLTGRPVGNAEIYSISRTLQLDWLSLGLGDGRSLTIQAEHFEKSYSRMGGQPMFVITLPDTVEELIELAKERP